MSVQRSRFHVHTGEIISTVSGLALLPLMLFVDWYGVVGMPGLRRAGRTGAETAWSGLTLLRWGMLLAIAVAVGSTVVHAGQRTHGTRTETGLLVTVIGSALTALLIYRVLIDPPDPASVVDIKLGAVLGLLAAIGIAVGGLETRHEERRRRAAPQHPHHRSPDLVIDAAQR